MTTNLNDHQSTPHWEQAPAAARSDVGTASGGSPTGDRPYWRHGMMLTAGAASWAIVQAFTGVSLEHGVSRAADVAYAVSSGLFQVGLLALLTVLVRTSAIGGGRLARFLLRAEMVLVGLAICSTAGDGLGITDMDSTGWLVLDMTWPLSMLGMLLIGVRIAIAGRWHGLARFWPLFAESWFLVVMPTLVLAGGTAATVVSALHLCLGYGGLGQIVARRTA